MWSPAPEPADTTAFDLVARMLDPVLAPLGFAAGQSGAADGAGQVIFCRGLIDSVDGGCVDLVVDLGASPRWKITDVRYWGLPSESWHLPFDEQAELEAQLSDLARTLPDLLARSE